MCKNKYVYLNEIIWLITTKMRLKMKNGSSIYDTNRPRRRQGHKYTKYKMCLSIMMVICTKQHLDNIWNSIHEKVKQHWGWVKKSVAYKKSCTSSLAKISVFPCLITMVSFQINTSVEVLPDKYVSRSFAITFEINSHKKVLLSDCYHVEPQTFSMILSSKQKKNEKKKKKQKKRNCVKSLSAIA